MKLPKEVGNLVGVVAPDLVGLGARNAHGDQSLVENVREVEIEAVDVHADLVSAHQFPSCLHDGFDQCIVVAVRI